MDCDNNTGTESDLSDWEFGQRYHTSEKSEESDDYGIYYDQCYVGALPMFDTPIGSGVDQLGRMRRQLPHASEIYSTMNSSHADSGYGGSLYPIHETGSTMTDSSGSQDDNSEGTLSNTGSPVHQPVYGSYHKLQNQTDEARRMESDGMLERLMLHRLPGEYLGMILGIDGGKDGSGTVTSVCVKSVTLGGAAHRATGGSKGVCVGDEIVEVNGLDLHTLSHDECVQVFKDMPLRVILGIQRGQKDIPPVAISPLPTDNGEMMKRRNSGELRSSPPVKSPTSPRFISPRELSDNDEDGFAGFAVYYVTVEKQPSENLGLSIVPSYGSTKQYYQIKRILPSGAAAQSGQLRVADRLVTCNGKNLRGLTQNHCLNIIRTASSHGNVTFEIIRPVYRGSSMEISVTVNPKSQKNPYVQSYDPLQYSLKSQSYDRQVDVVVTSESEDYLTVSEDEYSRTGRLANIPEVEANEVFASNSVKLAFQKPFNKPEEESTATETEPEALSPRSILPPEGIDIIDLNKGDTSPYHIPKQPSSRINSSPRNNTAIDIKDSSAIPKTDIDSISERSPRSPVLTKSPHNLQTDIDTVSVSSASPRSQIPNTDLDQLSIRTQSPVIPVRSESNSVVRSSYSKRQQVPVDDSDSITPPFNYPKDSFNRDFPADISDTIRYNPLYDSNASEATDSETPQDIYIASPDDSPSHEDIALPPPLEFSDHLDKDSPVTNIDDLNSTSVEVSPIHQQITFRPSYKVPNNSIVKLEKCFRDLEEASSDKLKDIPRDYCDSELAFNTELTAPFDSVLQEHGESVHKSAIAPVEFGNTEDNEILQVVQSYEDGTIVISRFDSHENRESSDSLNLYLDRNKPDNKMDINSEAMLKNALDMEYENLPDENKFEARIKLAGDMKPYENETEEMISNGRNVVAEKVAKEMVQNEGGGYRYYMESDDEPDQYPGEDEPEPALPDVPPPFLLAPSNKIGEPIYTEASELQSSTDTEQPQISSDSDYSVSVENKIDPNWTFQSRETANNTTNEDNEVIIPVTVKRKLDIKIDNLEIGCKENEEDIVVPQKIERNFSVPNNFIETPIDSIKSNKVKKAPPVAPKPSKSGLSPRSPVDENFNSKSMPFSADINLEPVIEDVLTATDVSDKRKKNLINVISVVNALKTPKIHEEPEVVDQMFKVDKKDILEKSVDAFMNQSQDKNRFQKQNNVVNLNVNGQISPPRDEVMLTSKHEITFSDPKSKRPQEYSNGQISPPKHEVIVTEKQELVKTSKPKFVSQTIGNNVNDKTENNIKDKVVETVKRVPVLKTSVILEKPKNNETENTKGQKQGSVVPPLNLASLDTSTGDSLSPESEKSSELSPSSRYKTTIGVTKPTEVPNMGKPERATVSATSTTATGPQFKTLSAIKPLSFNPKSLSQTLPSRPVQYKTTINTVGTKPSTGLSTLGRSSLLTAQKSDHPIKRMETMPFEVSILKGILGIGIKTSMTPEGFVKITEILPSGPVGREGNIKVGDYLLSINGTQLTGLPDGKVQQILRLLPRGLSKLVASVVPPDADTVSVSQTQKEKPKLAPQQSVPLSASASSLHKPTFSTNPEPLTISTRKPLVNTKSLPPAMKPRSSDSKSPEVSPRSKVPPATLPKPKERVSPRESTSPRSPKSPLSETSISPTVSPRQQISPRSLAPPVAPKPIRNQSKPFEERGKKMEDLNKPIETVIMASVDNSIAESVKTVRNILPGSINYDTVEPTSKVGNKGVVSSAVFKSQGNDMEGKLDVVNDTTSQNVSKSTENSHSLQNIHQDEEHSQSKDTTDVSKTENQSELISNQRIKDLGKTEESFEKIVKDVSKPEVDVTLLTNRNRSFSTSSDNESYTDFNECNVEEGNVPAEIVEEEETEVKSPRDVKSEEYESEDFQIEAVNKSEETTTQKTQDLDALKAFAETIVADVISNVQQINVSRDDTAEPTSSISEEPPIVMTYTTNESAPPLPDEPPPLPTGAPPPIPSQAPPPIPDHAPPSLIIDTEVPYDENDPIITQVDDLSLYPEDTAESSSPKINEDHFINDNGSKEVIDVVSSYHSAQLHAEKPQNNLDHSHNVVSLDSGANMSNSISEQATDFPKDQLDLTDAVSGKVTEDASVNMVIDLYSDIANDKKSNIANNFLEQKNVDKDNDGNESFEGKSVSSSDDFLSDADTLDNVKDSNKDQMCDVNVYNEQLNFSNNPEPTKDSRINGHSDLSDKVIERVVSPIEKRVLSSVNTRQEVDGITSLSPRSDSTHSPRTVDSATSDDDTRYKYTPDVDKVLKSLSQHDDTKIKGEGEVILVTINKGVTGLGFVIEGGKMSIKGDLPITVKRIFKGGPAEHHLQVGDEICEVNGDNISQMRRTEAWNHLKFLPSGEIEMKIRRFNREPEETDI